MSVSLSLAGTESAGNPKVSAWWRTGLLAFVYLGPIPLMLWAWYDLRRPDSLLMQYESYAFPAVVIWLVFILGLMLLMRHWYGIKFPPREGLAILHEEKFASGTSSTFGGYCSGCLVLVVTEEELWTTTWFPFTCFIHLANLEHRICKADIREVTVSKRWFLTLIRVRFATAEGELSIKIYPKHKDAFLAALDPDGALRTGGKSEEPL